MCLCRRQPATVTCAEGTVMGTAYPIGYGTARVSLDEMKRQYSGGMEPEYARRLFAWLKSKNGAVGVGSAWRPNPSNVSRASREGKSFHQTQRFSDSSEFFCAVDLVVPTKGKHSSGAVPSAQVPLQGSEDARAWGVHVNVGTPGKPGFESWHMQPVEIDGWTRWANSGRRRPAPDYELPVHAGPVDPPTRIDGVDEAFAPEFSVYSLFPLSLNKPTVDRHSEPRPDDLVRYLQGVMRNQCHLGSVEVDGYFGENTEMGVKYLQGWNGLEKDGRCGTATWACVDAYAAI